MSTPVTFFRQREQEQGETAFFEARTPKLVMGVYVYSRKPVESASLRDQDAPSWDKYDEVIKDLRRIVATQAGGGVIVEIAHHDGAERSTRVTAAPQGQQEAIDRIGLLRAGYPMVLQPANAKWPDLTPSSHLLVPVDREAQDQLMAFQEQLGFLPADLESLIVNSIRRPSLDVRMTRLESRVLGRQASEEEAAVGRSRRRLARLGRWLRAPALHWLVAAVVLGALLTYNALRLQSLSAMMDAQTEQLSDLAALHQRPTLPRNQDGKNKKQPVSTSSTAADLFSELAARKDSTEDLQKLYKTHFAFYGDKALHPLAARLFDRVPENRLVLLGLIKLEAMKLAAGRPEVHFSQTFFTESDNRTEVKQVFQDIGRQALEADPAALDLLAFLSCRLAFEQNPAPQLPNTKTPQYPRGTPPFPFYEHVGCDTFDVKKAEPGMNDLLGYVGKL
jgi:hypothetical protein